MKAKSKIELTFEGKEYTAQPYELIKKLIGTNLDGNPATDYPKILPLLDKNKYGKRLLLEAMTKNAKEFYELIKSDINDGKLNWNEKTNLLAYLMSSQRRVKSVKPFGSTKSSVELQRIVGAMDLLGDSMNHVEMLQQPQSLYGRKLENSHRGKPYLERAGLYIALGYLVRARLDLEIAKQYKKCDQVLLLKLISSLLEKMTSTNRPEAISVIPVIGSGPLVQEESVSSTEEKISARSRSSSQSSVDGKMLVSADDHVIHEEEPQSNLHEADDPSTMIDYKYPKFIEFHKASLISQQNFKHDGGKITKLADEVDFDRCLQALKYEFMNNQSKDSCDIKPLRAMIKRLERYDYQSSVVKNEMLVRGVSRLAPVSSEEDEYLPGSLMAFLSGENHLMDLAVHYGVIHLLRLIKALPPLSRSELTERCLDSEDAVGKQFVKDDKDDESIAAIKNEFLEKIKFAYKNDGENSKPWNKPGLFSEENLPDLFPRERTGLAGAVKAKVKQLTLGRRDNPDT